MNKKPLGIYVHIPFCLQKCNYCDFASFSGRTQEDIEAYLRALCAEILSYAPRCRDRVVDTVFFGGGTPTFLSAEQLLLVLHTIFSHYTMSAHAEISLEMNPATADRTALRTLRQGGFTRISIGMQSALEEELRILGRAHTHADFLRAYADAVAADFTLLNVDLMYALPHSTEQTLQRTLDALGAIDPPHVSAYSLKVEEGTPFARRRAQLHLPDEDADYAMYRQIAAFFEARGYTHYEISNYARQGMQCRHNLKYWRGEEYLGFGLAAYSYFDGMRYGNTRDLALYLQEKGKHLDEECMNPASLAYEYIMLRFRLREGIDPLDFLVRFGRKFEEVFDVPLQRFLPSPYLSYENGRYFLTEEGMYVSNAVILEFLDALTETDR